MAIYSCQIYDGDALVRDFVPARRASDNAVGLYDRASGAEWARGWTYARGGTEVAVRGVCHQGAVAGFWTR